MKRFACYCFITGVPLLLIIWFLTPIAEKENPIIYSMHRAKRL